MNPDFAIAMMGILLMGTHIIGQIASEFVESWMERRSYVPPVAPSTLTIVPSTVRT